MHTRYPSIVPAVKPQAVGGDRLLLRLFPGGQVELVCLTTPTPGTRRRFRKFLRAAAETARWSDFSQGAR